MFVYTSCFFFFFFFSSRRRHTRFDCDWSSDVCSSDLSARGGAGRGVAARGGRCPRPPGRAQRDPQLQDPGCRDAEGAVHGGRGTARGGGGDGGGAGPRGREEASRAAGGGIRGEAG